MHLASDRLTDLRHSFHVDSPVVIGVRSPLGLSPLGLSPLGLGSWLGGRRRSRRGSAGYSRGWRLGSCANHSQDVLASDAASFAATADPGQVDADFSRESANRWSGWDHTCSRGGEDRSGRCRRRCRSGGSWFGSVRNGSRTGSRGRCGRLPGLNRWRRRRFSRSCRLLGRRRFGLRFRFSGRWGRRLAGSTGFDFQNHPTDRHGFTFADIDLGHFPGNGGRDRDRCLICFHLDDVLTFADHISDGNKDLQDIA